jgi:hypothetical protein
VHVAGGGTGAGIGVPLAVRTLRAGGGTGAGIGVPLAVRRLRAGGGTGAGIGVPLSTATEFMAARLLDKFLTELLTGSTIKIAATNKANRTKMFFVMGEPSWLNHDGQELIQTVMI